MRLALATLLLAAAPVAARDHSPIAPGEGRGRLFVSPMGEPFRAMAAPERLWFDGADTDHDGRLTRPEFEADAARFFAVLDVNHDGEIDPSEIDRYETVLAPEIRVRERAEPREGDAPRRGGRGSGGGMGGEGMGGQGMGNPGMHFGNGGDAKPKVAVREGAARFGYLDRPEPVVAADRNGNRGIDRTEFAYAADQRFATLDRNHDGAITRGELPRPGGTR